MTQLQETPPSSTAAATPRKEPAAPLEAMQQSSPELVLEISDELTLSEVPEDGLPVKSDELSRHADVRREQRKLNVVKTEENCENPELEAALAECLRMKGGKDWLETKLMKLAKLHLLTAEELREENSGQGEGEGRQPFKPPTRCR